MNGRTRTGWMFCSGWYHLSQKNRFASACSARLIGLCALLSLVCALIIAAVGQEGGDRAETYFKRTACVAGVEDMRFQVRLSECVKSSFSPQSALQGNPLLRLSTDFGRTTVRLDSHGANPAVGPFSAQELMPDSLHWLGITKIDHLISMSDMKYNAIVGSGIKVIERVAIPDELIPADAHVEIDAKMYAGACVCLDLRGMASATEHFCCGTEA